MEGVNEIDSFLKDRNINQNEQPEPEKSELE